MKLRITNYKLQIINLLKVFSFFIFLSYIFLFNLTVIATEITLEDIQKYTMQDLINLAVENNPTLQASKLQESAWIFKVKETQAQKKYKLSVDNKITYVGNVSKLQETVIPMVPPTPNIIIPGQQFSDNDLYEINFSLQKPIYTGKKIETLIEESKISQSKSSLEYQKYLNEISYQIKEAYFNLLCLKKLVEVQQSSLDRAKAHLKVALAKEKAGVSPHLEVIRSGVEVKSEESKLLVSKNSLDLAYLALEKLLGIDLTKEMIDSLAESIESKRVEEFKKYDGYYKMSLDDSMNFAYKNRPEVAIMNLALNLAVYDINLAKSDKFPLVSFVANYSLNKGDQMPSKFRERWNLNMLISYSIFDNGKIKNSVNFAKQNQTVALKRIEEAKLNIDLEVNQTYLQLQETSFKLELAKAVLDEAKENFRLTSLRYEQGLGTNLDVIDAHLLLATQEANLYQSEFDLEIAKAKFLKAIGISY